MPWNTSGTFAIRFSVETLTANREILWPDIDGTVVVGAGIGSGVSTLTLHRNNSVTEGAELRLTRAVDDGIAWAIDVFGSGSVATVLRFIDAASLTVPMFIDQSAQSVFVNKLAVSATATHSGFTLLGSDAPAIKTKKLTGTTTATEGGSVLVAHGLTRSKVLGIQALLDTGIEDIPPNYQAAAGYNYNVYVATANVVLINRTADSANILSKAFKVLLTYEA